MKKQILIAVCVLLFVHAAISQNAGINNDGSTPETGLMLDVKGVNAVSSSALQNIFQIKSNDVSTDALKLRFGLGTNATASLRYGVIEVPDYVGNSVSAYRHLALQPLGGFVGIGITNPSVNLEVSAFDQKTAIQVVNTGGTASRNPRVNIYNYNDFGGSPVIQFHNMRGTSAVPAATLQGYSLGNIDFGGYDGTVLYDGAQITSVATENPTAVAHGTALAFTNKANGTTSIVERMRIDQSGYVGIGTAVPETQLHVATSVTATPRGIISQQSSNDGNSAFIQLRKGRGTPSVPLALINGDNLGTLLSEGYDGTAFIRTGSYLKFVTDGVVAAGSIPTAISITTGSSGLGTERLRITSGGNIVLSSGLPVYANNAAAIAGGLAVGSLYRTGADPDPVCIVH